MSIWRLDLQLLRLSDVHGPEWAVVAVLCLAVVLLARLSRAFLVGISVLLCSLVWYQPLLVIAHVLRWWVFLLLAFRGALWVMRAAPDSPRVGRVPRSVLALAGIALLSSAWAEVPWFSAVLAGTFVCTLVLAYVVAWRLMDTGDFLPRLCVAALSLALVLHGVGALLGAIALVTDDAWLARMTGVHTRFSGLMLNANGNGVLAGVLWPIVLASPRAYLGRMAALRWPVLVCLALAIVFSGSRTAVGITVMTTFVYALHRFRAGAVVTTALVGLGGAALLAFAPMEELEGSVVDEVVVRSETLADLGGRLERWERGWEVAQERPVLGHGWGAARTLDEQDVERSLDLGRVRNASNLHSTHISLLVDVGFVGLAIFWIFGASVVRSGIRILSAPATPETTVSTLFFASTLGMLANTVVHNDILSAGGSGALLFWFSTAVVSKQSQRIALGASAHGPEPCPESSGLAAAR